MLIAFRDGLSIKQKTVRKLLAHFADKIGAQMLSQSFSSKNDNLLKMHRKNDPQIITQMRPLHMQQNPSNVVSVNPEFRINRDIIVSYVQQERLNFQRVQFCQSCFSNGQHEEHSFVMNNGQDDPNWYPALRNEQGVQEIKVEESEQVVNARRVLQEMQAREITPEDYDTLKEVEQILRIAAARGPVAQPNTSQNQAIPLARYLVNAYAEYIENNQLGVESYRTSLMLQRGMKSMNCVCCDTALTGSLEPEFKCFKLKCGHFLHSTCMEVIFDRKDNKCPNCKRPILQGLHAANITKNPASMQRQRNQRQQLERQTLQQIENAMQEAAGPMLSVQGTLYQVNRRQQGPVIQQRIKKQPRFPAAAHQPDLGMQITASQVTGPAMSPSNTSNANSQLMNSRINSNRDAARPNVIVRQMKKAIRPRVSQHQITSQQTSQLEVDGSGVQGNNNPRPPMQQRTQSSSHFPPRRPPLEQRKQANRTQYNNMENSNIANFAIGGGEVAARSSSQGPRVSNFNSHIARMNRTKKKQPLRLEINGPAIIQPPQALDPVYSNFVVESVGIR